MKKFIPVSKIFDNEDDIFIFSRNVRKSSASENNLKKQNQKYYELLTIPFLKQLKRDREGRKAGNKNFSSEPHFPHFLSEPPRNTRPSVISVLKFPILEDKTIF